jgi:site-specific recombinase XerD
MTRTPTDLAVHISKFLGDYLPARRNLSANTVRAYRDAFSLLLRYCRDIKKVPPERLRLQDLDADLILAFLEAAEKERRWSAATRNHRLAALHSFFRYLQVEVPEFLHHIQRVLAIPMQRAPKEPVTYLSVDELVCLLRQPDRSSLAGRRDDILLTLLYDTGARVQEVVDLSPRDIRLEAPAQVRLTGKGRKTRVVPLMPSTADKLRSYLEEHDLMAPARHEGPLFCGRLRGRITRSGIRHILEKYRLRAGERLPKGHRISPHTLRHSKAMHLLQSGVPLVIIRNILGHEDVKTTEVYAKADLTMKRRALEQAIPSTAPGTAADKPSWTKVPGLLDWLRSL